MSVEPGTTVFRGVRVFDGGGRVLMPGLIDAHWHATFAAMSAQVALTAPC
jgi:imidazolonepropionase-like amidohydrolase